MSRFAVLDTPLGGLKTVRRHRLGDSRGFLSRIFCADDLASSGWDGQIAQINQTRTAQAGTVRGMHFQRPPNAEIKLVSCLKGKVWDVAVDLRAGSPTFLACYSAELSADNELAMLIPKGFAHGFQTLTDDVELLYCHSAPYSSVSEAGLHPRDERLSIDWPLDITEMSARDASHAPITAEFKGVAL